MSEHAGKEVTVKVSGTAVTMTDEACTNVGNDDLTYQISNAAHQVIDINNNVTVKVDGSTVTTGFTVNRLIGTVVFDTEDERTVTITAKYLPLSAAAYAHEYNLGSGVDLYDVTRFGDTYKRKLAGCQFAYGSLKHFNMADEYFSEALTAGLPVVIEITAYSGATPKRLFALFEQSEIIAAVGGAQDASVSFISTAELYV
jgi:uncharacterized membrane protein YdfJ with MMPL/SSD domain